MRLSGLTLLLLPLLGKTQVDTLPLNKSISILNDKFTLHFPAGAANRPRVADIMSADPNRNIETRIFFENGDEKLVFFATEAFMLAGDHFLDDLNKAEPATPDFTRKQIFSGDSLIGLTNTPSEYDTASGSVLINSLLVKNPDRTVSRIDAFISNEAFAHREAYTRLTEKIFATLAKGNRRISLAPRTETYTIFGTPSKLKFSLPKNYVVTVDEKYDFSVIKVNAYREIGDTTYSNLTLYTGHHPSYFYKEYNLEETAAVKQKGSFLKQPVDWLFFRNAEMDLYLREQFVPVDFIENGLILHVAITTNTDKALKDLSTIADSIQLEK